MNYGSSITGNNFQYLYKKITSINYTNEMTNHKDVRQQPRKRINFSLLSLSAQVSLAQKEKDQLLT